jgi:hypothetical protein
VLDVDVAQLSPRGRIITYLEAAQELGVGKPTIGTLVRRGILRIGLTGRLTACRQPQIGVLRSDVTAYGKKRRSRSE